jgi:hypothetical protein
MPQLQKAHSAAPFARCFSSLLAQARSTVCSRISLPFPSYFQPFLSIRLTRRWYFAREISFWICVRFIGLRRWTGQNPEHVRQRCFHCFCPGSNTCTGFPARCLSFMLAVALTGLALHPNQRVSPGWSIESSHSPTYRLPAFDPWLSLGYYSLVHHSFSEPCGSSLWFAGFPVFDAFSPACA